VTLDDSITAAAECRTGAATALIGDRIPGAAAVIAKVQVLILPNANVL
jgi:hypothetical protein